MHVPDLYRIINGTPWFGYTKTGAINKYHRLVSVQSIVLIEANVQYVENNLRITIQAKYQRFNASYLYVLWEKE